jgi:hypothetical protein
LEFSIWLLGFVWDLGFGAWYFHDSKGSDIYKDNSQPLVKRRATKAASC